uniref:Secreted protein n=1 Tax=Arundo donax TaxID=35708 RepID=A0A0A8YT71_ARUDO
MLKNQSCKFLKSALCACLLSSGCRWVTGWSCRHTHCMSACLSMDVLNNPSVILVAFKEVRDLSSLL